MKTIWKYELEVKDEQFISIPNNADFLSVDVQRGKPCLWVKVDTNIKEVVYTIAMVGTGNLAEHAEGMRFIGTYQLLDGNFVGHVFVEGETK